MPGNLIHFPLNQDLGRERNAQLHTHVPSQYCLPGAHHTSQSAFKPVRTLGNFFKKPKDRPNKERLKGIVYKLTCRTCSFAYVGGSKRNWKSRGAGLKPGTNGNINSAIKHRAEIGHDIHPSYAEILETGVSSKNKILFLESLLFS